MWLQAAFKHFTPFSEIIVGPCHAGAFGPNDDGVLDETFGGSYEYQRGPLTQEWNPFGVQNLPPPVTSVRADCVRHDNGMIQLCCCRLLPCTL